MNWIDAHCHLADSRYDGRLAEVLDRARRAGVTRWIQGGIDPADWAKQRKLKEAHGDGVIVSLGLHPWGAAGRSRLETQPVLDQLERELPEASVLGEIGLDYMPRHLGSEENQLHAFRSQLALAKAHRKPAALHVVHAHEPALQILKEEGPFPAGGWVHLYTGSYELACRYIEQGFVISVGGPAAREKGYETLKRAIPRLPADALILETDSPDQSPDHAENEPARLVEIAQAVANLRRENWKELLDRSTRTLERFL